MKKIISTMAMACLSFSCLAEDYFVKVAKDEYVMQHGKNIKKGGKTFTVQVYTPTHVFTYPDGDPICFRNIRKIDYTKSKVIFVKDIKTGKCCVDIYDGSNPNKCRIIGVNGFEWENFEVYDVEGEANSFTDDKQRLIYVDDSGLYIVEKGKNSISESLDYFSHNTEKTPYINNYKFKGEIIKISAIDGKREMSGFDENKKDILAFNCPSDAPVSFEIEATPVMKQIEEITGVKLITPPPSEEAALKRMAEILDVPVELLVIDDGQVKLASKVKIFSANGSMPALPILGTNINDGAWVDNPLIEKLKGVIGVSAKKSAITKGILKKAHNYTFDTSDEAKKRRKEIALKPWDEE